MPPTPLPEQTSPKAARILGAARELLLRRGSRGFTVADIATRAHVGKGTVYLYWDSKEDLLVGLVGREFLAVAEEAIADLEADPDLARPTRLSQRLAATPVEHDLIGALHKTNDDLLGAVGDDPRSGKLLDILGPSAMLQAVLPIWRRHGLADHTRSLADQAFALHTVLVGFITAMASPRSTPPVDDPSAVLATIVTAVLGPERATPAQVRSAAAELTNVLRDKQQAVLDVIARTHPAASGVGE